MSAKQIIILSPLKGWAISTGGQRPDISTLSSLHNRRIGVSRLGSGSYVMGFVLADAQGWPTAPTHDDTIVLHTFERLRNAVNSGVADFFMWEHFTSKRYYDSGKIRKVGEIYTPWSSWKIVASTQLVGAHGTLDERVGALFGKLDEGMRYFEEHQEEAVAYISTELDYSEEDAREWLKTVKFPARSEGVDLAVVEKTVGVLQKAGVLVEGKGLAAEAMVAKQR